MLRRSDGSQSQVHLCRTVICSYFKVLPTLESSRITDISRQPPSALFATAKDSDASISAGFGGQGTNEVYFDELQNLYDLYTPYVPPFVQTIDRSLMNSLLPSSTHPPLIITTLASRHDCPNLYLALSYRTWLPSLYPSRLLGLHNSPSISWRSKSRISHLVKFSKDFRCYRSLSRHRLCRRHIHFLHL